MKFISFVFVLIIVLTGFSAGMGFANIVGYMPGMKDTPPNHLISFWQHADHYFRARMPFFGNALLLSLVVALFLIRKEWQSGAFLFIGLALITCISDLVVILTMNLPLNVIVQTLDPESSLNIDFEPIRARAMQAYYIRAVLNILSFGLVITGVVLYLRSHVKWIDQSYN